MEIVKNIFKMSLLVVIICLSSCVDDNDNNKIKPNNNNNNDGFCQYVSEEKFELTGEFINDFLKNLDSKLDDYAKLEKLCDWLKTKDCVLDAEIRCVSCIETLPEQSELIITFATENGLKQLVMDISMSKPLVFVRYH